MPRRGSFIARRVLDCVRRFVESDPLCTGDGLEWNVRLSGVRNPDALAKVAAVFDSYWEGRDFVDYNADEFRERTALAETADLIRLSPPTSSLARFKNDCSS